MPAGPVMFKILIAGTLILGLLVLLGGLSPGRGRRQTQPVPRTRGKVLRLDRQRRKV